MVRVRGWETVVVVRCVVLSSQNWFPACPGGVARAGRNTRVRLTVSRARTVAPPPPCLSLTLSRGKGLRAVTDFLIVIQSTAAATGRPSALSDNHVCGCDPVIAGDSSVILIKVLRLSWSSPAVYHHNYNNTALELLDIRHQIKMLLNLNWSDQIRICQPMTRDESQHLWSISLTALLIFVEVFLYKNSPLVWEWCLVVSDLVWCGGVVCI